MYHYYYLGLKIQSEIELPLQKVARGKAEVNILRGEVPAHIESAFFSNDKMEGNDSEFLLKKPCAHYHVLSGTQIIIQKGNSNNAEALQAHLLRGAIPALLRQRGLIPFHTAAIVHQNQAVLICGQSGAGKSTLAASFLQNGYRVIADDLAAIKVEPDEICVFSGQDGIRLTNTSTKLLNISKDSCHICNEKLLLPNQSLSAQKAYSIKTIFHLKCNGEDHAEIIEVKNGLKPMVVLNSLHRRNQIKVFENKEAELNKCIQIAKLIPIKEIRRPKGISATNIFNLVLKNL